MKKEKESGPSQFPILKMLKVVVTFVHMIGRDKKMSDFCNAHIWC